MASLIWSHSLSGWPGLTLSAVRNCADAIVVTVIKTPFSYPALPGEKGAAFLRVSYLPCAQAGISTLLASRAGCWRVIGPVPRRTLDISDIGNSIA